MNYPNGIVALLSLGLFISIMAALATECFGNVLVVVLIGAALFAKQMQMSIICIIASILIFGIQSYFTYKKSLEEKK